MCMKMLDAAEIPIVQDGIREADEDNPKGYYEYEKVKDLDKGGDNSWISEARGKVVKIISFLLPHLPPENNYKIVFMGRNIDEILASQNKMLVRRGEPTDTTADEKMKKLYSDHLIKVRSMLRYRDEMDSIVIQYNDVLTDPRPQAEQMNGFLGGQYDVERMLSVVDKNLYRNRAS
ncbi:MAG: sulfotransferase family protein [Gemmatimonadetes bacterium]|nr:sulfotransferase family protein [Gemmatimonadota bacterium]